MTRTRHKGAQSHERLVVNDGENAAIDCVKETASAVTTNNTATVIASIPLAEGEAIIVQGIAIGLRSTGAESIRARYSQGFRRAGSGNVTAIGSTEVVAANDSGGTPTLTVVANTGAQTVDITVTGENAKEFSWRTAYEFIKVAV
jgi:hypothetical protein